MRKSLLLTTCIALAAPAAFAQEGGLPQPPRGVPVQERARPDLDPAGIRAGAFLLFPELTVAGEYTDNVYATEQNTESDYILVVAPEARFRSDWNNHALNARFGARLGRFADNSREDFDDYVAAVDGRLDVRRSTKATGVLSFQRLHEARGTPDDVGGLEPAEYGKWTVGGGLEHSFARAAVQLGVERLSYDYDDVRGLNSIIDQDDRDRDITATSLRVSYSTSPNLATFVEAAYNWRRYDRGELRDSEGYRLTGGVTLDFGGVTSGDVFAGYRAQDYENPAFAEVEGFTYGARVLWNPTLLTSVEFTAANTVEETIIPGSTAYVESLYRVEVNHELLRNLILTGTAAYVEDDFKRSTRTDDVYSLGVGARYLLNRHVTLQAAYGWTERESNANGRDFDRNTVSLRLIASL